jgi:sugar lactone lactonase YvrE
MSFMNSQTEILLTGLAFPESPRWRDDRLWLTDQHARKIITITPNGVSECILEIDDLPGGLGWLPDASLLIVAMTKRMIYRLSEQKLDLFADLSALAPFHCNDMVVSKDGRAYVGNFGYDLHGGGTLANTHLIMVESSGLSHITETELVFPNGSVITPDGTTLIVAETFANRLTALTIDEKGLLHTPRIWAHMRNATPDGICLDSEGALWVASPGTHEVLRVKQGGKILARIYPLGIPYACMLGGHDRQTLFILTSETDDPEQANKIRSGRVEIVTVNVPGAGLP